VREKEKTSKSGWLYRQLVLAIIVALFFSLSMTWVELDPVMDHQKNVEMLRSDQGRTLINDGLNDKSDEIQLVSQRNVRHTDGLVFGASLLVIIIIGGVVANIRNY
jgi:hypothetical protein